MYVGILIIYVEGNRGNQGTEGNQRDVENQGNEGNRRNLGSEINQQSRREKQGDWQILLDQQNQGKH